MWLELAATCVVAFAVSLWLTGSVRRFALSRGVLDVPNARSSHKAVTPRGGGLATVVVTAVAWLALAIHGPIPLRLFMALVVGGAAVAAVGFVDDRRPVPARLRLTVHLAAAIWALLCLGAPAALTLGSQSVSLGWMGVLLAVLGIVWFLNLFNFMDGIDGIAASEAIFIVCAGPLLMLPDGTASGVLAVALPLAASCCGFLLWNWPPAKIFMGDVGSGYLGYVIGVMVLALIRYNPNAAWVWLILGGVFFVDATVTLIRRAARGERVAEAHRSHAYQWLARRHGSHRAVTMAVTVLNVLWLLPCAFVAARFPQYAMWTTLLALLPVAALALLSGAGRSEAA